MFLRGYFKLHDAPSAFSGALLLGLSLAAGDAYTSLAAACRVQCIRLPAYGASPAWPASPTSKTAQGALLLLQAASLAAAIFYAGIFPMYTAMNRVRYWHAWQDGLASGGWMVLAVHHMLCALVLAMLLGGLSMTARAAPLLLLLPASHMVLRLFRSVPPSTHFWLGACSHMALYVSLAALYSWRAYVLREAWELLGTAAMVFHLTSLIPEIMLHCISHGTRSEDGFTRSWIDPWGSVDMEHMVPRDQDAGEGHGQSDQGHDDLYHTPSRPLTMQPAGAGATPTTVKHEQPADSAPAAGSTDSIAARVRQRHGKGSGKGTTPLSEMAPAGVSGHATSRPSTRLFTVDEPATEEEEGDEKEERGDGAGARQGAGKAERQAKKRGNAARLGAYTGRQARAAVAVPQQGTRWHEMPSFELLVLINMASFFCLGGLVALTIAPSSASTG